jgi:hypothetical protein
MTAQLTHEGTPTTRLTTSAGRGRLAFHRIRQTIQEMNDASRRVVELQAPWSVDKQWHRK